MLRFVMALGLSLLLGSAASAQNVNLTEDMPSASFDINGTRLTISRIQDNSNHLTGEFAKTSRDCPPFCIHPISAAPGVETIGELELIDFMQTKVASGAGLLLDSRVPDWFEKGAIPGAVNVPFTTLEPGNPYHDDILQALGAVPRAGGFDFTNALDLALYCNGPWCDQSPRAIRDLLAAGYPAAKLKYYRGGMQLWLLLGLTVDAPQG